MRQPTPRVSLVLTCRNTAPLLDVCLRSHLLFTGSRVHYVVADTSDDTAGAEPVFEAFREALDLHGEREPLYVDLRNKRSRYSRTCHDAALRSRDAGFHVFSNDDTVATPGWLEIMLEDEGALESAGYRPGLVGARSNRVSGIQCCTGVSPPGPFPCPRLVTFFALIRTERYFEVGGFDLDLPANNHSDDALCVRLIERGYTNWCSRAFIPHFGSQSFKASALDYMRDHEAGAAYMRKRYPSWPGILDGHGKVLSKHE